MTPEQIGYILQEYARQIDKNFKIKPHVDKIEHCALGIGGEGGEVVDLVKKSHYIRNERLDTEELRKELGDLIWYVTNLCTQLGTTIPEIMLENIDKLNERHGPGRYDPDAFIEILDPEPNEYERDPQSPGTSFRP